MGEQNNYEPKKISVDDMDKLSENLEGLVLENENEECFLCKDLGHTESMCFGKITDEKLSHEANFVLEKGPTLKELEESGGNIHLYSVQKSGDINEWENWFFLTNNKSEMENIALDKNNENPKDVNIEETFKTKALNGYLFSLLRSQLSFFHKLPGTGSPTKIYWVRGDKAHIIKTIEFVLKFRWKRELKKNIKELTFKLVNLYVAMNRDVNLKIENDKLHVKLHIY